jgi:hypothetical protein
MHQIVSRYRGKISSWELWNEPDIENYWLGTPEQFAEMIEKAVPEVRSADPNARIVLGGMARGGGPFFAEIMRKYRIGDAVDAINLHGYLETWDSDRAESYPDRIQKMRDLIIQTTNAGATKDLWMAEFGYSDYRYSPREASEWGIDIVYRYEHTPSFQAAALWRAHVLALATHQLSLTTWYRINDLPSSSRVIGDNNNKHLGLLDVSGHRKAAFYAFKLFSHLLGMPVRSIQSELKIEAPENSQSVARAFERRDGSVVITSWLRSSEPAEVADQSGLAADERHERVRIRLPERFEKGGWEARFYDLRGRVVRRFPLREAALPAVNLKGPQVLIGEIVRSSESTP